MRCGRTCVAVVGVWGIAGCPAAKPEFPSVATDADDDGGDDGGAASMGSGADDATGADPTTDGPSPGDTGPSGPGMLVVDAAIVDFGNADLNAGRTRELVVTNVGGEAVTGIDAAAPTPPFRFAGELLDYDFPGEGGDCSSTLAGGESCSLVLEFFPTGFGEHTGSVLIESDGDDLIVPLRGQGVGTTANLLVNGGGEQTGSPPPGWIEAEGAWESGPNAQLLPVTGVGLIEATDAWDRTTTTLLQDVAIAEYSRLVDFDGMRVHLDGELRTDPGQDHASARLTLLTAEGAELHSWAMMPQVANDWFPFGTEEAMPAGTRLLRVELVCERTTATETCQAYFDDVSLTLEYDPSG